MVERMSGSGISCRWRKMLCIYFEISMILTIFATLKTDILKWNIYETFV